MGVRCNEVMKGINCWKLINIQKKKGEAVDLTKE